MPTHRELPRFQRDYSRLSKDQQALFKAAVRLFVEGLLTRQFGPQPAGEARPRLPGRVGAQLGVGWTGDVQYGGEIRPGEVHIVWRRIGTHAIFREP